MNSNTPIEPPKWFQWAMSQPYEQHLFEHNKCKLNVLTWGDRKKPPLFMVHGGAAHAQWWQFLAPFFAENHYVVAPDLSGHGESDHRSSYPRSIWAEELKAIKDTWFSTKKPFLVGHSMGGLVSVAAGALFQDAFSGIVVIDSPIRKPDPESQAKMTPPNLPQPKVYPDLDKALGRFRLLPQQPCDHTFIMDHLARTSLKKVEGGWTWKFDPMIFAKHSIIPMADYLARVTADIVLIRGEHSTVVPKDVFEFMSSVLNHSAPLVEIPDAHHHLILDQPIAFISCLRAILATWKVD